MADINFVKIQDKWQKKWEDAAVFKITEDTKKPKFYCLEMFPYPSGSGLHMGHAFNYSIGDIYARFKRMRGHSVLYPMGFDSFGLPAENSAIKKGLHPKEHTEQTIANFIKQLKNLGLSYDWDRMLSTCTPEYYKWNQFIFLKFLEKGLVYRKEAPVNWCPECTTVLANEQVHNGKCWRHTETLVEKKLLEQWFIKTTAYAEELLDNIESLEWPERIKTMQENWIGKSTGVTLTFDVVEEDGTKIDEIKTYTTRVDTVYGITYLVLAAEHPKVIEWTKGTKKEKQIKKFISEVKEQSVIERTAEGKEKNGLFLGKYFINPFTKEKCPLWVADYALYDYGTGAVMAVPAHDQRDFEFAKKYDLPIKIVINPPGKKLDEKNMKEAYAEDGEMIDSGEFDKLNNREAIEAIADLTEKNKWGMRTVNYRLKDWLVSRQRYWGTPIPIIKCKKCGMIPVPEDQLPVTLPDDVTFGEGNPLESNKSFVNTKCPACGSAAVRETDTMDTFFDSSWYFLRFCDNKNTTEPFDKKKIDYWMPVDQYVGGAEHACMHLIYARFFTKALRDLGYVSVDEPFTKLFNQGMLHGDDGYVMSKSRGNVVLPEEISKKYGIDTARFFLVSIASPEKDLEWSDSGIEGSARFINRVIHYFDNVKIGSSSKRVTSKIHRTIKDVTQYIEQFKFNFVIIKIRELFQTFEDEVSKETLEIFLKLMHPFCPHMTEELWEKIGNKPFITTAPWPEHDDSLIDEKADAADEFVHATMNDIQEVLQLVKIETPKKIDVLLAQQWTYDYAKEMKAALEESRNPWEIIKRLMNTTLKKYGKEIAKMVPKHAKDPSKLPQIVLSQKEEKDILEEHLDKIKEQFGCTVNIIVDATEPKAKQALPGKPALIVE